MTLLILGVALWWGAHLMKSFLPGMRTGLSDAVGEGQSRGVMALLIVASVVLMVIGYIGGEFTLVYDPPVWGIHLNNLLMLIAVFLFGLGSSKGSLKAKLRHPMLLGFIAWVIAHLLVNGDLHSIILFGGLGLWAVVSIFAINARMGPWTPPAPGPIAGDIRLAVISIVVFAVIALIHGYVFGYWPFPG